MSTMERCSCNVSEGKDTLNLLWLQQFCSIRICMHMWNHKHTTSEHLFGNIDYRSHSFKDVIVQLQLHVTDRSVHVICTGNNDIY